MTPFMRRMMKLKDRGMLMVLSGPSGSGKNTVLTRLLADTHDLYLSVSATTRSPRDGEIDGVNYHFVTKNEFEKMLASGDILEHTKYCGNYYGTLKNKVLEQLESGNSVILEIEVEGGMQVKKAFPEAVLVFLTAPSLDEVKLRLINRQTESIEVINERIARAKKELEAAKAYDYLVINDSVEKAACELDAIITAEKCRVKNRMNFLKKE